MRIRLHLSRDGCFVHGDLGRVQELIVARSVVLGVFDALLVNPSRLWQMSSLAHMIDHLQVLIDLVRCRHAILEYFGAQDLLIKIV